MRSQNPLVWLTYFSMWILRYQGHGDFHSILVMSSYCFLCQAQSVEDVMKLLQGGNQRRTTEPTVMNVTSSRSHAVFQVRVERRDREATTLGKLSLIDLAGSERASQTHNSGMRLLEGANINRSLLALGNCINALASGSAFVPFRDSKLTRLLKDSLGGNCRTVTWCQGMSGLRVCVVICHWFLPLVDT